jgi:uncharacterized protein
MWRSTLLTVALIPLAACTTLSNTARSYMTASNGLQIDDDRVRALMQRGMSDSAFRAISNRNSPLSPDDRLLRLLYQGSAARYAGQFRDAGEFFDRASAVSDDRFTKSLSRTAMSLVTNDYALPYTAGRNERLLLHYNALLTWSAAHDADAAAVEARRLVALLARVGAPDADERPMRAAMHVLAAAAFEQAGDWNDADVARRNAAALGAMIDTTWRAPEDSLGDLVIVVERGDVAHKVAVGLTVPIFDGDNVTTDRGDFAAQRLLGDFGALRNGGVWWDDAQSWRFTNTRYSAWDGARASYLLDMSWPVLRRTSARALTGSVEIESESAARTPAAVSASFSDALASDYRRDRGAVLSRTVTRAVSKYLAARAAEEAAKAAASKDDDSDDNKKKDKGKAAARAAGSVARMLTNVATTALERADTRSWTLLPGEISIIRLRLPAGTHEVLVAAGGVRQLSLPGLTVIGGRTTVVSARLWRESVEGVRSMVERANISQPAPER